jgi:hypothetical protein
MIRQYDTLFRKNLKDKISKVSNKEQHKIIYQLIVDDLSINKITKNNNGIYFNINKLTDKTISKILSSIASV